MTDTAKARALFKNAELAFPQLPREMALSLKERDKWLFSSRHIETSPYNLDYYVNEIDQTNVDDYVILAHSGHGSNSYAIQYYLVYGKLQMFLHLGWGGVYMDNKEAANTIRECFGLASRISNLATMRLNDLLRCDSKLKIIASDSYGSYWSPNEASAPVHLTNSIMPQYALAQALAWVS